MSSSNGAATGVYITATGVFELIGWLIQSVPIICFYDGEHPMRRVIGVSIDDFNLVVAF